MSSGNSVSEELLLKLRNIHKLGYVKSLRKGDIGVGMTLEHLLGIETNNKKSPDYQGIEIKATRTMFGGSRKFTLFSQVPNWDKSNMSADEILNSFGYIKLGRLQLYCTVSTISPNPQGLYFIVDDAADTLLNKHITSKTGVIQDVALWEISKLRSRLLRKHNETFWVSASSKIENGTEFFVYESVQYTRKPNAHLLSVLLDEGIVTMEYTLRHKNSSAKDHGYLFKIKSNKASLLFPNPIEFNLGDI